MYTCDFTVYFETLTILRRTERGMIKIYFGLHEKRPLYLSEFNETCILSEVFRKNASKYQIS